MSVSSQQRSLATMLWLDVYVGDKARFSLPPPHKKKAGPKQKGATCSLMIIGRGISSRNESHAVPLPERPDEALPFPFIHTVSQALDSYLTASVSDESLLTEDDPQHILVTSNNGWTTGNSTERSSLFSWGDDEFDKQSAKRVQRMFEEIDSMLYEGQKSSSSSSQLHNECKVWKSRFPHLRILGSQLLAPRDDGFQLFPQGDPSSATTGVLLDIADHEVPGRSTQDRNGLTLSGHHIHPIASLDTSFSAEISPMDHFNGLDEEIFEVDGIVEEFFAYDQGKLGDDENHERKRYHTARRREGFPPLTPNACVQNTVMSQVFDVLWAEIVGWMRMLVRRHQEDKDKGLHQAVESDHQDSHMTPILAPTFAIPLSPSPLGVTTGRLMEPPGKLAPMGSFRAGPSAPFNWQTRKPNMLTGVMTISSKALHNRQGEKDRVPSSLIEEAPALPANLTRPNSSSLAIKPLGNRPTSTRLSDVHGHRMSSARGGKSRLRPLERTKTPSVPTMEGIVMGKRMMTANDRLNSPPHPTAASPPHHWSRNTMLPPIEAVPDNVGILRDNNRPPTSSGNRESSRQRISSAVIDNRSQKPSRQLLPFPYNDSRPNTTHSFRSDMMLARRSSTPQGMASLLKANLGPTPVPGHLNDLGIITGRGINPGGLSQLEGTIGGGQYGPSQPGYLKTL
ncbi:protein FAM149B1-like [Diadema antillarum]|uniref:protein FAM149B1-like n=1 Tax=Diadema antillarum TaxID=105358 RepID=UPI003A86ADA6